MNPRRSANLAAAFYPTVVVAGWAFVSLTHAAVPRTEDSTSATQIVVEPLAPSPTATVNHAASPQTIAPETIVSQTAAISSAVPATEEVTAAAELAANPPTAARPEIITAAAEADLK